MWQEGQLVPEEAMDCVPRRSETAVPEWKAKCEPFAQHDSIQLPRDLALLHLLVLADHWFFRMKLKHQDTQGLLKKTQQEKAPLISLDQPTTLR